MTEKKLKLLEHPSKTLFYACGKPVSLHIAEVEGGKGYVTSGMAKGLILCCGGRELVQEGAGLGLPLLKLGREIIFPGIASVTVHQGEPWQATVEYKLNLVQRISSRNRPISLAVFYEGKEFFSWLHRRFPILRPLLRWGANAIRRTAGLRTGFETVPTLAKISAHYSVQSSGFVRVALDLATLRQFPNVEVVVCNELGADHFDFYQDSSGLTLEGKMIGAWKEVRAERAWLVDRRNGFKFELHRLSGARLYRGRELEPGRLAWSGLNYVFTNPTPEFCYEIGVKAAE